VNPKTPFEVRFSAAVQYHRSGRLLEAERLYRQIIALDRHHFDSFYFLGMLASQLGRNDAVDLLRQAAKLKPGFAEVHNDLGTVLFARGDLGEALASFQRAVELKPTLVAARQNLGNGLKEAGRLDDAIAQYKRALAIQPGNAGTHVLLGSALQSGARLDEATDHYRRALRIDPKLTIAHYSLGTAYAQQGKLGDAVGSYQRAIALAPDFADAHNNLAGVLKDLGKGEAALFHLNRALALQPNSAGIYNNLGNMLSLVGKVDEAVTAYRRAIVLNPGFATAHYNLGLAMQSRTKLDLKAAAAAFEQVLQIDPARLEAKLGLCIVQLPVLYDNEEMVLRCRARYSELLNELCTKAERTPALLGRIADATRTQYPFFLPYQGYNDRDLQSSYGRIVCQAMADRYPGSPLATAPRPDERVRVGFVSGFFYQHTVWKLLTKGWLSQLDRQRFQVFGYHTGSETDSETDAAPALCARFVKGPLTLDQWRATILADAPHVLIYPDVGMDLTSVQLAAQRLAPIQCAAWGHPETTGFPTIDHFLSSELMEPAEADAHYTERLVRLPNLSIHYEPLDVEEVTLDRSELGLRPAATVFWSAQTLMKYLPQYDQVLPRIARQLADCQFVFIEYPGAAHVTEQFKRRLEASFASFGMQSAEHCVFLPRLEPARFVAAAGLCDVGLDTIGWSGGNTTLEALLHDLPIVTLTGPLMRGRHATAILRMMGVVDTIAETIDDYVSCAVSLGKDAARRLALRSRIAENKHRLYRDRACIRALEEFLDRTAREGTTVS
jgi:protein O-GlcNAc transferase